MDETILEGARLSIDRFDSSEPSTNKQHVDSSVAAAKNSLPVLDEHAPTLVSFLINEFMSLFAQSPRQQIHEGYDYCNYTHR